MNATHELRTVPVDALRPHPRNPRFHPPSQIARLAESIKANGFGSPVLADESLTVLAGHGRILAAKSLGMTEIPVVVLSGLDEAAKTRLLIADNKVAEGATWDDEILHDLLAAMPRDDAIATGFESDEISRLLDPEPAAQSPKPLPSNRSHGKYFETGGVAIYYGDCLEIMRGFDPESVDMIFCDPPYGHNNNDGDLISSREAALGRPSRTSEEPRPILNDGPEANALFESMIVAAKRVLVSDGCCCCCCGGGPDPMFARWSLIMDRELTFKQMVVWDKGPMGMGWHYRRSYETVLVAHKGAGKWHDDTHKVENIIRPGAYGISKIIPSKDQHPTEKPVELSALFIRLHTLPGEIVLDPFAGSGSTLVAALREGRKAVGIELDERFAEMAARRITEAVKGDRI